jgi:hypothetical protein
MPPPRAEDWIFYVGDEKIKEYGGFAEGIFIKVYGPQQLQSWRGKPIRILYRGKMTDLGASVPAKSESVPPKLPSLEEALRSEKPTNTSPGSP